MEHTQTTPTAADSAYTAAPGGVMIPVQPVSHRDEEYDETGFDLLVKMQRDHFWYRGRHRFLLHILRAQLKALTGNKLSAIDLGGGCGGWIVYLKQHAPDLFDELALSDSSVKALEMARPIVGPNITRYQIDLLNLGWKDRWDVAFLLDVLEHIPDHHAAMRQAYQALKPGGLLIATTPALQFFWSYNDEMAHHVRRYSRKDYAKLAGETGFQMAMSRYFMFFLSPLLALSRMKKFDTKSMTREQINEHMSRTHRVPSPVVNGTLSAIFGAETPIGHWIPFPWGTSVLGVFRKPI